MGGVPGDGGREIGGEWGQTLEMWDLRRGDGMG